MAVSMLLAQAAGEYGALSGIRSAFEGLWDQAQVALSQPKISIPVIAAVLLIGYFLLRRR